mgnify:CR=1 FL=1
MYLAQGTQIKLFRFYDSDSAIGMQSRQKVENEVNEFLNEHTVTKIEISGNIIMVVYRTHDDYDDCDDYDN